MKTSQLIMLLEKCQKMYGDLPVYFLQEWEEPVENVEIQCYGLGKLISKIIDRK